MTRVLGVDDKADNLAYLEALLRGHGFEVDLARHGAEALVIARKRPPDLVISDLLMPVMDGYTLLRHWKADPRLRRAPFIVYSATYTSAEDERLALDLGADAFLLKPTEPEVFVRAVTDVLDRARADGAGAAKLGGVRADGLLKHYSETLIRKLEEKTLQLEAANAEQRVLLESIPHIMWIAAPDGTNIGFNQRWIDYTGLSLDEGPSHGYVHLIHPDDRDAAARRWVESSLSGEPFEAEYRLRRVDGEHRWMLGLALPYRDESGEIVKWIGTCTDIHDLRSMEAQLLRAQRLESIGTLAGGIAHDLNNLLAPIVAGAGLLRLREHDEETRAIVDTMEASAQRGAALVRQVLSYARGIEGVRLPLHVEDVIDSCVAIVRTTLPATIDLRQDVAEDLCEVVGDHTQLDQVLLNLCGNAKDAMPSGGTLQLRARNVDIDRDEGRRRGGIGPGRYVAIEVEDDGTGIAPEIVERIFEPFLTTKEVGSGTGLGLSTAAAIVRSHGGSIDVATQVGVGTTFTVLLPAAEDDALPGAPDPAPAAGELDRRPAAGRTILVVDDEEAIVDVIARTLEAHGYRVRTAADGGEAVEVFRSHDEEIDAVLTDLMLPVLDGAATVAAIRTLAPDVPIIATSGLATPETDRWAEEVGVHFLAKPYPSATLLQLLDDLLAAPDT